MNLRHSFVIVIALLGTLVAVQIAQSESIPEKVCFLENCFEVEIAKTAQQRARGLQNRESLKKREGMLFIFSQSNYYSFWMKDTLISLDIIWLDQDKRIVTVMKDIVPCKVSNCPVYTSDKRALYVLEINAGISEELGLKAGDQAVFH